MGNYSNINNTKNDNKHFKTICQGDEAVGLTRHSKDLQRGYWNEKICNPQKECRSRMRINSGFERRGGVQISWRFGSKWCP